MSWQALSPDPTLIQFNEVAVTEKQITIKASTIAFEASCPRCNQPSERIHSTYIRCPRDLPCVDRAVHLELRVRRFFCKNASCLQKIFTERLGGALGHYARKTTRLLTALGRVVCGLGGEAGSRLLAHLNMASSSSSLLRLIERLPLPHFETPAILGVDDWAIRKGQTYATVLVDLEKGEIIDLLPDRKSETLAAWLREHPGVKVISRDRGGAYAKGAREGAPEAIQVADRWHLVHNLSAALERLLYRHYDALRAAAEKITGSTPEDPPPQPEESAPKETKERLLKEQRRRVREERYEKIKQGIAQGDSINSIARSLGMVPRTVKKYLREGVPTWRRRSRRSASSVAPYDDYLRERWEQGCHNSKQLWRELKEKGFDGSSAAVKRYVRSWRGSSKPPLSKKMIGLKTMTARQAVWLLIRTQKPLTDEKKAFKSALFEASPLLEKVGEHVEAFQDLLVGRTQKTLSWWMETASKLGPELASFVNGINLDLQAVENAVAMPWSQGPTEGHVNRIKTIKRQMYGRAGLELLRRRLLLEG